MSDVGASIDLLNMEMVPNQDGLTEPLQEYEDIPSAELGGLVRSDLWEGPESVRPE